MSDRPADVQGSDKIGHVIVETTGEIVELEFADGTHRLNRALVAHLGGPDEVRKFASEAKNITHQEFVQRFWHLVEKSAIKGAVNNVIQNHFALGRRF